MGFIILGLVIIATSVLVLWLNDWDCDPAFGIGLLAVALTIVTCIAALIEPQVEYFKQTYSQTVKEVAIYRNSDIVDHIYEADLCRDMQSINNQIDKNRKYAGTFWCGAFTSKEIAVYEKFDIEMELTKDNL